MAKRSLNRLTAQAVKNEKKPGLHNDGGNLYLSIQPGGTKSWVFRYTRNGKAREMGLGPADHDGRNGGVTLARARILATDARRLLHDGKCPLGERRRLAAEASAAAARAAVKSAFRDVAESWFEAQKKGWKNAKHIATVKASLESSYPVLGSMHVADITTDDVLAVLSPIWHTTTESTTRLRQRIEAVLSYAKARKLRTGDNPAAWRDNLKHILPPPESIHIEQNQPSLPWERMPEFLVALRSMEPSASRLALEFQILTAVRPNEAARAEWTEFDFDKGVWTIPADRMKGRRGKTVAHSVWLTPAMRRVLQEARALPRAVGSRYVFPGKLPGKPLSEQATNELVKGMCETTHRDDGLPFWCEPSTGRRVVPHGFRSSFTVFAQDGSLARKEVTEACLAHIISDKVYAAYGRSKFERMRFQAHLAWEHFLYEGEVKRVDIGEIPLAA